ncbi:MAG: membrane protein insertion efficiency factor YidD [Kiloniellales bacterium]|nr:membrane protein insertion efficiency factor YidD [Kiloniellales bacterium]
MNFANNILVTAVRGYQLLISPILGPSCRFHPTCSQYASEALQRHGTIKGLYLALARVLRCQPWAAWGDDPVPERFTLKPWRRDGETVESSSLSSDWLPNDDGPQRISHSSCGAMHIRGSE